MAYHNSKCQSQNCKVLTGLDWNYNWLVKPVIAKPVIVTGLLLVVAVIAIVSPWYPRTTSQVVPSITSYTTQFETATTSYQLQTIYTLPSPIYLQPDNTNGGSCPSSTYYCDSIWVFSSENLTLQSGINYTLSVNDCKECYLFFGGSPGYWISSSLFPDITGSGEISFVPPGSGIFHVVVGVSNLSSSPQMLTSILIWTRIPQKIELMQTLTTYSTTSITQYSQTTVPFYTIFEALPSEAIIAILAFAVFFFALREREITHRPKQATLSQFVNPPTPCIKCGSELPPASEFCNKCGTKQEG